MKRLLILVLLFSTAHLPAYAGEQPGPHNMSPNDKCPVCGMFVAIYPDFACRITFKDGGSVVFDGAKDMFSYYFDMTRYGRGRQAEEIVTINVTDYNAHRYIDGRAAWYVIGSDVNGPMGRELIPFAKEADAAEFMKEHKGKELIRFGDVNKALINTLG